jgi:hypothetical protein
VRTNAQTRIIRVDFPHKAESWRQRRIPHKFRTFPHIVKTREICQVDFDRWGPEPGDTPGVAWPIFKRVPKVPIGSEHEHQHTGRAPGRDVNSPNPFRSNVQSLAMCAESCKFVGSSESDNLDELSDYFEFYTRKCFRFDGRKLSVTSQV